MHVSCDSPHAAFPLVRPDVAILSRACHSIKPQALRFGICKVVPPPGWKNPTQVDFASSKPFATKLQRMNLMQEGRAMGDGKFYNVQQYREMADEFRKNW